MRWAQLLIEIIICCLIAFFEFLIKNIRIILNIKNICVIKISLKFSLRKVRIRPTLSLRANAE